MNRLRRIAADRDKAVAEVGEQGQTPPTLPAAGGPRARTAAHEAEVFPAK
jgi:hypothetical protein